MNRGDAPGLAGSVALGAWTALGVLTMVVVGGAGAPLWLDDGLLGWSIGHRPDVMRTLARAVTDTGTGVIPYVLATLAGFLAARAVRQRLLAAAFCLACLGVGQALRYGVMELVHRARPPRGDWAAHASGWAFPSGHATTGALAAGLLMVALTLRAPRGATSFRVVVGCWGLLVGLTRVYLGVHWFTDVLGGWLFAVGWLGVCLYAAGRWLPALSLTPTDTAPTAERAPEDHAPQNPDRRG
ncbi:MULTISPECIES: phosphatase PAP2 family protein [Streptomyces violaceusniger group]|uniref:Phosphatase PAP2 family protein n=1 Tax=Streptomyces javensis TaxID=114698 RepID=A0ABS0R9F8_9ACTN|nr:phosphatase PAP2 family protein [Streptomyces javensis]MBI0314045.1 phosphatase PAP2 family protein [Streptomyces javensis]